MSNKKDKPQSVNLWLNIPSRVAISIAFVIANIVGIIYFKNPNLSVKEQKNMRIIKTLKEEMADSEDKELHQDAINAIKTAYDNPTSGSLKRLEEAVGKLTIKRKDWPENYKELIKRIKSKIK